MKKMTIAQINKEIVKFTKKGEEVLDTKTVLVEMFGDDEYMVTVELELADFVGTWKTLEVFEYETQVEAIAQANHIANSLKKYGFEFEVDVAN